MRDENGCDLTEKEIIKNALDHLAEACCFLFEAESDAGKALAFMADSLLKYGSVVYNGDDPLIARANFDKYEYEVYLRNKKGFKVIK